MGFRKSKSRDYWIADVIYKDSVTGKIHRIVKKAPVNTRDSAKELEASIIANLKKGAIRSPSSIKTLSEYIVHWKANNLGTYRPKSRRVVLWTLNHLSLAILKTDIRQIKKDDIAKILDNSKLSDKSKQTVLAFLKRIFHCALEDGIILQLPKFPKIKVASKAYDFYSREECNLLLANCHNMSERLAIMLAIKTGIRLGEQRALRWCHINFENQMVTISENLPDGQNVIGSTKSNKIRHIPLNDELFQLLKDVRQFSKSEYVCVNQDGERMTGRNLRCLLGRICVRAGLRVLRWHDLRGTFASLSVSAGVPIQVVSNLLGHSNITLTMKAYAHLIPNSLQNYRNLL